MKNTIYALILLVLTSQVALANNLMKKTDDADKEHIVDVFQQEILKELDQPGQYSLATLLGMSEQEERAGIADVKRRKPNTRMVTMPLFHLLQNSKYNSLHKAITGDLKEIIETYKSLPDPDRKGKKNKIAFSSKDAEKYGDAGNHARHFDYLWLQSSFASFPLIAVVNRLDRKDFSDEQTCGELRFIYRLAYHRRSSYSTMPVFINLVFESNSPDCQQVASAWKRPEGSAAEIADQLKSNALDLDKHSYKLKQLEINMQAVRFPSGQKIYMGGQAIYLFRIFQDNNGSFESIPLENTPDVTKILKDESGQLMNDLIDEISTPESLRKIDEGTFVLSNKNLLAYRALSFSTGGRSRLANKPFSSLFLADNGKGKKTLENLQLPAELKWIKSNEGLFERLNNLTCTGCHQTNGTAGFHTLGLPSQLNHSINQVTIPFSPHYSAERERRRAYIKAIEQGQEPNRFRPHSVFLNAKWNGGAEPQFEAATVRDLCLPESNNAHFKTVIGCGDGSVCRPTVKNDLIGVQIGECVTDPKSRNLKSNLFAGHTCREGKVDTTENILFTDKLLSGLPFNFRSYEDKLRGKDKDARKGKNDIPTNYYASRGETCGMPRGGVPLGRMSRSCTQNSAEGRLEFVDNLKDNSQLPKDICAIRGGAHFDLCAAGSSKQNLFKCLAKKLRRSKLDTCHLGNFCREDYICQAIPVEIADTYQSKATANKVRERIKKLHDRGVGFCTPNYFVFNMRIDSTNVPEDREKK